MNNSWCILCWIFWCSSPTTAYCLICFEYVTKCICSCNVFLLYHYYGLNSKKFQAMFEWNLKAPPLYVDLDVDVKGKPRLGWSDCSDLCSQSKQDAARLKAYTRKVRSLMLTRSREHITECPKELMLATNNWEQSLFSKALSCLLIVFFMENIATADWF